MRNLRFHATGTTTPALAHSLPRPDVRAALYPDRDPHDNSYASGFYAVLPLAGVSALEDVGIFMHIDLEDGRTERHLIDLFKALPAAEAAPAAAAASQSIAICMATHDPPYDLFARQIESLSEQSYGDWRCIISDDRSPPHIFDRMRQLLDGDDRFLIDRSELRLGAYHNFERALGLVSEDARYVALADQDDRWYPEKLQRLLEAFAPNTTLAYSDCRITSPDGALLSDTFFARRRNNSSDLRKMLLANTVTGASSMFRRDLLDHALPFPPVIDPRVSFHDHWLAVTALSLGPLVYVDDALYDYVQHGENVVGHAVTNIDENSYRGPWMVLGRATYQSKLIRSVLLATVLGQRLRDRVSGATARQLRQLSTIERSPVGLARMVAHAVSSGSPRSATEGVERDLVSALVWRRRMSRSARKRDRLVHPWYASAPEITTGPIPLEDLPEVRTLTTVAGPLPLEVSERHEPRVNFLMHRLEIDNVLDNDRGKLSLADGLATAGVPVRIIALGDEPFTAEGVGIEVVRPGESMPVSPTDAFIATDWLTAYSAHLASTQLGGSRFLYVIDEFAGQAASPGASSEASATYAFPHCALFWGERLESYFRSHRLGVFSDDEAYACITPALTPTGPPDPKELTGRSPSRLLLHAPPSDERSEMFEIATVALHRAVQGGLLSGWEVNAIGTPLESVIRLGPAVDLAATDPASADDYADLLRAHDIGISLSPTLRLCSVAMEMAAAGLPTITLCLDGDDRRWLEARSENFLAVEPTTESLTRALHTAIARASEPERRVRGSAIDQPTSWPETFGPDAIAQINSLINSCRQQG